MIECYCLTCLWAGEEDQLVEDVMFLTCPICASTDIIFLID